MIFQRCSCVWLVIGKITDIADVWTVTEVRTW